MRRDLFILSFFLGSIAAGCVTEPVTGRRQLSLVSEEQLMRQSERSFRQVVERSAAVTDPAVTGWFQEVAGRVACASREFMAERGLEAESRGYEWEFVLLKDDKTANAFAMPGGKVVAYSGILVPADTPGLLAAVLSHEAAHDIARHAAERASHLLLAQLGETTLSIALQQSPRQHPRTRPNFHQSFSILYPNRLGNALHHPRRRQKVLPQALFCLNSFIKQGLTTSRPKRPFGAAHA